MNPESARLFLALWPDPAVRGALRSWRDAWTWPRGASPVQTDKLHMTLHFLGNQPRARLPELLDGFTVPFSPFELRLDVAELWHGGIAVLSPQNPPQPLLDLHAQLSQALLGLGKKGADGIVLDAREPDTVGGEDVHQGAQNGVFGGLEIVVELFGRKMFYSVDQPLTGPR